MICMNNQCRCAPPNRPDRICDSPRSESEMIATIARDRRNNERHVDGKTSGGDRRRLICRLAVSSAAMFSRVLTVCRGATFSVAERERRARRVIEIAERSRARARARRDALFVARVPTPETAGNSYYFIRLISESTLVERASPDRNGN